MTKVGFTGTQTGMTRKQLEMVAQLVVTIEGTEFHHGDCIGADFEAAGLAKSAGYKIMSHPPENSSKRAYFNSDEEYGTLPYIKRNHVIVDETEILIAVPKSDERDQPRSGTWATIRYARLKSKKVIIIRPDGNLTNG